MSVLSDLDMRVDAHPHRDYIKVTSTEYRKAEVALTMPGTELKRGRLGNITFRGRELLVLATELDMRDHLDSQRKWSLKTFGPDPRVEGLVDHIRKELDEVLANPEDVTEWIDIVILALDGAWRAGHNSCHIATALVAKQSKNEHREWPDWRSIPEGKAIEHVRTQEVASERVDAAAARLAPK